MKYSSKNFYILTGHNLASLIKSGCQPVKEAISSILLLLLKDIDLESRSSEVKKVKDVLQTTLSQFYKSNFRETLMLENTEKSDIFNQEKI